MKILSPSTIKLMIVTIIVITTNLMVLNFNGMAGLILMIVLGIARYVYKMYININKENMMIKQDIVKKVNWWNISTTKLQELMTKMIENKKSMKIIKIMILILIIIINPIEQIWALAEEKLEQIEIEKEKLEKEIKEKGKKLEQIEIEKEKLEKEIKEKVEKLEEKEKEKIEEKWKIERKLEKEIEDEVEGAEEDKWTVKKWDKFEDKIAKTIVKINNIKFKNFEEKEKIKIIQKFRVRHTLAMIGTGVAIAFLITIFGGGESNAIDRYLDKYESDTDEWDGWEHD